MNHKITKTNSRLTGKSKFRTAVATILLSLVMFTLFIVLLEMVLRTTHLFGAAVSWTDPSPILSWRYAPKSKYWQKDENDHPITGRINSYGWRDKERSLRKAPDTYRIAVLGDSMVAAYQVESEATFLALAENKLAKNYNLNVELMNFGRPGMTQTEELLVLKNYVEQFSPDMVMVVFWPLNDISDVARNTCPQTRRPFYTVSQDGVLKLDTSFRETRGYKLRCIVNSFKRHSALISLIAQRYNAYRRSKLIREKKHISQESSTETQPEKLQKYLTLCTDNPDAAYAKNYKLNKTLLKAMSNFCKERSIRFMMVCGDTEAYIPEVDDQHKAVDKTFNANFFEDDLKNYAKTLNADYLGLQRVFRNSYVSDHIPLHWGPLLHSGHWNYDGHKLVADTLVDRLVSIINENNDEEPNG